MSGGVLVPVPVGARAVTRYQHVAGAPLLLRSRFAVTDAARVRVLELRVAYADGFVAFVNGKEVARRGLSVDGVATAPHGPEIERVFVALPLPGLDLRPDDNMIALAVYAMPGRSAAVPVAPAASVTVAAAAGVRVVRGPYLIAPIEQGKHAGVSVAWETDLPATGSVTVEPAGQEDQNRQPGRVAAGGGPRQLAARVPATRQVIAIDHLARGAGYRYRVDVEAAAADVASAGPFRFTTAPPAPAPLRFAVYGDMRYPGHEAHRTVVAGLVREAPTFVFNTGDLTDEGSQESNWQRYFDITAPLGAIAPVVPALGNHDASRKGAGRARAWALFGVPSSPPPGWTSFDIGGVHFVLLDTNDSRSPAQTAWLAEDLARARRHHARAAFAFCHEAPWSHGLHGGDRQVARDFGPVLARGGVDVLFCGHDHIYERGTASTSAGKLAYVVTGGGGAPLYDPTCAAAQPGGLPPGKTIDPPLRMQGPLPACPDSVAVLTKAYHYIIVEVSDDEIQLCPRRPDGSEIEPCVRLPGHGKHRHGGHHGGEIR